MEQNTDQSEPNDQLNSEGSERSESEDQWKRFKDFARKVFAVKPEELDNLPPEGEQEGDESLPKIN